MTEELKKTKNVVGNWLILFLNDENPDKKILDFGVPDHVLGNFIIFCHNIKFTKVYVAIQTKRETKYYDLIQEKEIEVKKDEIKKLTSIGKENRCHAETKENLSCRETKNIHFSNGFYVCDAHKEFFNFDIIDINEKL